MGPHLLAAREPVGFHFARRLDLTRTSGTWPAVLEIGEDALDMTFVDSVTATLMTENG
jgi:hypothetical protein